MHRGGGREREGVDMEVEEEERDGVIPEEEEDSGEGLEDAGVGLRSAPPLASSGLPGRQAQSRRPPRSSRPDTHPTTDASATIL